MKLQYNLYGHPAEDWQRRFVIIDQIGSTCRIVSHPIMSNAMLPPHEPRLLASHSCDREEDLAIISQAFPSASFTKPLNANSNGKEVKLHNFNSRGAAPSRSFEKCSWKLLEDVPEDGSGSQIFCASDPWKERSEDIDALLSSDEELSTGRCPNMDEKTNIERTFGLATGELVNKLNISEDEDLEVNSKPSTCNADHNQPFGKSLKSSEARRKRKIFGLYHQKRKSSEGHKSSFKSRFRRENISRNIDLKSGQSLNTQLILEQAIKTAK